MKRILIFIFVIFLSELAHAQKELCPYDTLLNNDITALYTLLDELHLKTLLPFIENFLRADGKISAEALNATTPTISIQLRDTTVARIKHHEQVMVKKFQPAQVKFLSCLQCSVNKELTDYRIALLSLAQHLDKLPPGANSGFRYNDVMSAYHHLVSARSALMAMVDATLRYHQVQRSITESEKRVKRHVTIWGAVTLGFATVLYLIHDDDEEK